MVREDGRAEEALDDAERAEAEGGAEDGEVGREEAGEGGEGQFGEREREGLEEDEEPVEDGPEGAGGLVGDGAVSAVWVGRLVGLDVNFRGGVLDVVLVDGRSRVVGIGEGLAGRDEGVDGLDVLNHAQNAARKEQKERHDAQHPHCIEKEEKVCRHP